MKILVEKLMCQRSGKTIFTDLSFSVLAGQKILIRGPNGSGKTTLLRAIAGILPAKLGLIEIDNSEEIFLLGHNQAIKGDLTVKEDLVFWANFYQKKFDENILEKVFLKKDLNTQCKYLSQGQRQKLSLTRLFCSNKKIWLLDEPFSFLDLKTSESLNSEIDHHCMDGGIALIVSHQKLTKEPDLILDLGSNHANF